MRPFLILALSSSVSIVACSTPADDDHNVENHSHENHDNHENHSHGDAEHGHDAGDSGHSHEGDAAHSHGDVSAADLGADVTITPEAETYCECMLVACHDPFHDEWGAEDPEALANCGQEASALTTEQLACRQNNCSGVADDSATCEEALGDGC